MHAPHPLKGSNVQAARSGKQNIAEAGVVSGTSKEMEIKLTNVARASLEESKIDCEDFLRTNKLFYWLVSHQPKLSYPHSGRCGHRPVDKEIR